MKKIKTIIVGEAGVGKTCIAVRFARNEYNEATYATVGAANLTHEMKTSKGPITFNIWDTAGQERYRSLTPMYFSNSQVAILVFDITSKNSLEGLDNFYQLLQQKAPKDCALVLVGNKSDIAGKRQVKPEEAQEYANKIGALFYQETSAATGEGINDLFEKIATFGSVTIKSEDTDYIDFSKRSRRGCC
ncbi:small GTP-binding protein, putative [Trichomonas vaginalis G3]|uniref:Small GTP-binding protein, putative n=2 Tax=Trichomonas vaginalis (strain ATCC PRA-98 / G3) TaxID=412133 RepID=A2GZN9_TRIV3|nr:GTPase protein [Trichomonas vaginalis G3]EAX77378.1 small GTP-binding protein, putative [Trichomonas vaginalis G3]KAI5507570.1 GTPase protein [Trichomonas vaginalis G3]|eukprot:XP_001290308.1 small GTP-binding protein [Trichomonas vaginalis G3]